MVTQRVYSISVPTPVERKSLYLSEMELFQGLSSREMEDVMRVTTMTNVPKGRVFWPSELGEVLFILKKGRVQIYRLSPEGKKLVLTTLGPGSVFGEMTLTGQRMYDAFVETLEESLICIISRSDLERLITEKPQIALRLLDIMGRRLYDMEKRLEELAFKKIPARLAALLLRLREEQGDVIRGYTHQDLAEIVGTYRETVTQVLNEMKARKLIEIQRKTIRVLNPTGLEQLAEE